MYYREAPGSSKLSPHLPPIPCKQKPMLDALAAEATQASPHRSVLLDALEVHEREFVPLCAELALRRQLGDSCGV